MNVDLSQFHQVFFEESAEHLAEMERILLSIDLDRPDGEDLNAVFRAAHSIKGGAGTFGFPDMAELTHALETLLDRVRDGELALTRELVDLFLAAGDAIAMQLAGHREGASVEQGVVDEVCRRLAAVADQKSGAGKKDQVGPVGQVEQPSGEKTRYRIVLSPPEDLFKRAVRLEGVFEEMAALGEVESKATIAPIESFEEHDPLLCRMSWEITLTTTAGIDDIRDVFLFVADDDEIDVQPLEQVADPAAARAEPRAVERRCGDTPQPGGRRLSDRQEAADGAFGRRNGDAPESSSIRVGVSKVDQLINQMGELVITQAMLAQSSLRLDPALHEDLHRGMELLARNVRDMQESVMSIRMIPIGFIFGRFPRLVHDLAAKLGKEVELKMVGEGTELDRGLIERLADPLTHLVRNSLDHGIEEPQKRLAVGKPATGSIVLRASQTGGRIIIEVEDDGAGLDRERILDKARQQGLSVSSEMSDEEVWQLIFAPGFSTAESVSDISGRGVGMDVVMKNVQGMGGRVLLSSQQGAGCRVVVSLPLTLAILDGLSVRVGGETFIVPLNSIVESLQPKSSDLSEMGGNPVVRVRDSYLPLVRLGVVYGIAAAEQRPEEAVVMIAEGEGEQVALLVDELLNQQQVVIKSLESNYHKVDGTAGATIMGDGRVALILDVPDLVRIWRGR